MSVGTCAHCGGRSYLPPLHGHKGGIVSAGIRVLQRPKELPWIALPQVPTRRRPDGTGSGWAAVLELNDALSSRLQAAVLVAYRIACACPDPPRQPLPVRGQGTWDRARAAGTDKPV